MADAQDIINQKKEGEEMARKAVELSRKQKDLLNQQIREADKQLSDLRTYRAKLATDLSKLP